MNIVRTSIVLAFGAVVAVGGAGPSGDSIGPVSRAEARVGRPLTPVSYAGVARRTTRRAAYVGAAAASQPSTTVIVQQSSDYPPECVRSTDSTGATIYRCP